MENLTLAQACEKMVLGSHVYHKSEPGFLYSYNGLSFIKFDKLNDEASTVHTLPDELDGWTESGERDYTHIDDAMEWVTESLRNNGCAVVVWTPSFIDEGDEFVGSISDLEDIARDRGDNFIEDNRDR